MNSEGMKFEADKGNHDREFRYFLIEIFIKIYTIEIRKVIGLLNGRSIQRRLKVDNVLLRR
jgi:hypothetical protein